MQVVIFIWKEQEVKTEEGGGPLPFMLLPAAISAANWVGLCERARSSLFVGGGLGEERVMRRSKLGDASPGSGARHPCSPGALAKAAASGRASSERGADFCRLLMPRIPIGFATAKDGAVNLYRSVTTTFTSTSPHSFTEAIGTLHPSQEHHCSFHTMH